MRFLIGPILLGVNFILLYINQTRYLFGGDSAEYSTVSATWSIPHPPGYPFYSFLLNILRIIFPFFPVYLRNNLLSIVPTVITSVVLYKIIAPLIKSKSIALFASLFYVVLFPIWLYAQVPEVFALNNLILVLITYFILQFNKSANIIYKYLIFFLLGLAVSHHHSFILLIPGWYVLLKGDKKGFIKKDFILNILFILVGASFYLYAPIASHFQPPIDWENAGTLDGFTKLITRASYGTFKSYYGSSPNLINQLLNTFSLLIFLIHDFRIIGIIFIIIGFISMRHKNKPMANFVVLTLLFQFIFLFYINLPLNHNFSLAVLERFFLAIYLVLMIPFAQGAVALKNYLDIFIKNNIHNLLIHKVADHMFYLFLILLFIVYLTINLPQIASLRSMNDFEQHAINVMSNLPKESIISTKSDSTYFTTENLYYVRKYRNDLKFIFTDLLDRDYYRIKIHKKYPYLTLPKYDSDKANFDTTFLTQNSKKYEIFFEKPISSGVWLPYGLLWKYYPDESSAKSDLDRIILTNMRLWGHDYIFPKITYQNRNILHLLALQDIYNESLSNFVNLLINENKKPQAKQMLRILIDKNRGNYRPALETLMILTAKDMDCKEAKYYKNIYQKNLNESNIEDLSSILKYYYYCDYNNASVSRYLKIYNSLKAKQNQPLNNL